MRVSSKMIYPLIHVFLIFVGLLMHIGIEMGYEYYTAEMIVAVYSVILIPLISFHSFSWYVLKESKRKDIGISEAIEIGVCAYVLLMSTPSLNDDTFWIPWLMILLLRIIAIIVRKRSKTEL